MTTEPTLPLIPPTPVALDEPPVEAPTPAPAATPTGPRVRWAGIIWGAVLAGIAASALWLLADPARSAPIREWLLTLSPESFNPGIIVGVVILVVGVLLLIGGAVALLHRAQIRASIEP